MLKALLMLAITTVFAVSALAQSNTFTYQGKLNDGGAPANGTYLMQFSLWDALSNGNQIGPTLTFDGGLDPPAVQVTNGIFAVQLDFGNPTPPGDTAPRFDGSPRWIAIAVRKVGEVSFTPLNPRQPVTSSPYSIKSSNSGAADSLSTNCVLCVVDAHIASIDGSKVTGVVSNAQNALNAANAVNVTGIVPIGNGGTGSSSKNFVDLSTDQSVAGNKSFSGSVNVTGPNGVFNGNGAGLTNLNGSNISGGTVTVSQLAPDLIDGPQRNLALLASRRWDVLKAQASFTVGTDPVAAAFDGANIWVANLNGFNVTKIRASDGANLGSLPTGNGNPNAVAFDGTNIWVTNNNSTNSMVKLRASDGANQGTFSFSGGAAGATFDGSNIWITSNGNVLKLKTSDGSIVGTFSAGAGPIRLVFDGANIWVANFSGNSVTKLRASDGTNLGTFTAGTFPVDMAFDGANIWIANQNSNNVTKLRASDGANLGTFPVGTTPVNIGFDGVSIWVSNFSSNNLIKLKASDGSVLGTFSIGTQPEGMAFDGANLWVTVRGGGVVVRMPPTFP